MGKLIDLTGQTFGLWTVLFRAPSKKGETMWWCECGCENKTKRIVSGRNLRNGKTKSCGCIGKNSEYLIKDLTGERFGKLVVLKRVGSQNSHATWLCKCDCGNTTIVAGNHLTCGNIKSCGCTRESHGELKIKEILENNNINFEQQKKFENCKDIRVLPFDFYIDNKYLIEFDGEQHFKPVEHFKGEEGYKIRQEHDEIKNQYCKDNNIPLIRIPYTHLNDLCLEDLLLETSQFIII